MAGDKPDDPREVVAAEWAIEDNKTVRMYALDFGERLIEIVGASHAHRVDRRT